METISIIIPVYNTEEYLDKCVESVVKQTYSDLEILLIDDGSSDSSSNMCDNWASHDNRISVIHKTNGGLSSARNEGIRHSKANYIMFIDSDDYIDDTFVEHLANNISDEIDIVATGLITIKSGSDHYRLPNVDWVVCDGETAKTLCYRGFVCGVSACGKLFKKSLFNGILFPEGELYEDLKLIPQIMGKAHTVCFSNEWGYYYVQRKASITHSLPEINEVKTTFQFFDSIVSTADNQELKQAIVYRLIRRVKEYCRSVSVFKQKDICVLLSKYASKYKDQYLNDKMASTKEKLICKFISRGYLALDIFCILRRIKHASEAD